MSWLRHSVRGSLPLSTLPKCAFRPITIPRYTSTLASKSTPRISPLNVRRIVYVSAFTFLSAYFGIFFQSHPTWLAPPSPDSEEDKYQVSDYVKKLSALILPASEEEIQITYDEGNHIVKEEMRGIRGLAEQRAWWNKEEKRLTIAVWFGGSLAGWPGVTHGGVVATMFMEGMKKAIELGYGSDAPLPDSSTLSLTYLKPTKTGRTYMLVVQFEDDEPSNTGLSPEKDLTRKHHDQGRAITQRLNKKYTVNAALVNIRRPSQVNHEKKEEALVLFGKELPLMFTGPVYAQARGTWDIV